MLLQRHIILLQRQEGSSCAEFPATTDPCAECSRQRSKYLGSARCSKYLIRHRDNDSPSLCNASLQLPLQLWVPTSKAKSWRGHRGGLHCGWSQSTSRDLGLKDRTVTRGTGCSFHVAKSVYMQLSTCLFNAVRSTTLIFLFLALILVDEDALFSNPVLPQDLTSIYVH